MLEDVVGEHHREAIAVDEALREPERLGDAAGILLVGVEKAVDAPLVAVAQQPQELTRVGAARDDHHLADPGLDERLDRVVDHRAIEDGQQVLVRDAGERVEPAAGPTGEDHALHGATVCPTGAVVAGSGTGSPLLDDA